jgi:hypothetical protein
VCVCVCVCVFGNGDRVLFFVYVLASVSDVITCFCADVLLLFQF